jgi:hypothetical protein
MVNEDVAAAFARHALSEPAIPLEQVQSELSRPTLQRARAQVNLLIGEDGKAVSAAAARLDDLVDMLAAEMVVRPDTRGDLTLVAESLANAVLPLAQAVLVRDQAPSHPEIRPLLELADRVVPGPPR